MEFVAYDRDSVTLKMDHDDYNTLMRIMTALHSEVTDGAIEVETLDCTEEEIETVFESFEALASSKGLEASKK